MLVCGVVVAGVSVHRGRFQERKVGRQVESIGCRVASNLDYLLVWSGVVYLVSYFGEPFCRLFLLRILCFVFGGSFE